MNATLTYTSTEQLTAQRPFDGQVGTMDLMINIANGPQISGPLDAPIHPVIRVSGSGVWMHS